ncbi:hypothetical protein AQUCO_01500214v1 [Aquilegia coerulea]|uniref:tRNA/rRNA methyltransferase SpoU type domain-containing protein n=1 Tax=Aquilegia coerulea TaxID=218851 RepID=A0A2G5DSL9_AQUCA|nr:hypothetical protein AQUCO_01500214v1 [Aquilegia coerulea]
MQTLSSSLSSLVVVCKCNVDIHSLESNVGTTLLPNNVKFITNPSNPFVKHCVKLRQSSSYRHSHASVLLLGTTPIREEDFRSWFPFPHRVLVLDGIQDPGNLGTLLRSAVAFRWDGVFLLPGCCDPFNDKALRASRGSAFQLPIVSGNWDQLETLRKGFQMKMLAGHPESNSEGKRSSSLSQKLADSLVDDHVCLVLGSEGYGISKQSEEVCELINIPMAGDYESLNVSVAGGIFLFMLQPKDLH